MNKHLRTTLSGFLLTAILAGAFSIFYPRKVQAETPDREIPIYVKGKQFTIVFGNGEKFTSVTVIDIVLIHKEPWWRVMVPMTGGHGNVTLTVNPRQIEMLADLP